MRRYLILFLVFLLPLQISWATAANYCGHEQEESTDHLGHHQDEHHTLSYDAESSNQPVDESGTSHDHNHLSGFVALLLGDISPSLDVPSPLSFSSSSITFPSLPPERLERPNWFAPA